MSFRTRDAPAKQSGPPAFRSPASVSLTALAAGNHGAGDVLVIDEAGENHAQYMENNQRNGNIGDRFVELFERAPSLATLNYFSVFLSP